MLGGGEVRQGRGGSQHRSSDSRLSLGASGLRHLEDCRTCCEVIPREEGGGGVFWPAPLGLCPRAIGRGLNFPALWSALCPWEPSAGEDRQVLEQGRASDKGWGDS